MLEMLLMIILAVEAPTALQPMLAAIIALAVCIALTSIGFIIYLGLKIRHSLGPT